MMKSEGLRNLAIFEMLVIIAIAFFSMDFLPRNYNTFLSICSQTWPKDPKQYEICLEPYYRQTNLDKKAIVAASVILFIAPAIYFWNRKKK